MDMTAVNYLAASAAHLIFRTMESSAHAPLILHFRNPRGSLTVERLIQYAIDLKNDITLIPFDEWKAKLSAVGKFCISFLPPPAAAPPPPRHFFDTSPGVDEENALFPLKTMFSGDELPWGGSHYDTSRHDRTFAGTPFASPPILTKEAIALWLNYLRKKKE